MLGADPQQSGPRFIIHRDTAAFAARSDPGPITPSSVSHGIGPTLIHIKLRAGVWVCPRKAVSIDPIDAAEPSEPSHDQYGKPIGTVTLARNSQMRSTEQSEGAEGRGSVQHAAGEAPLVVIPTDDMNLRAHSAMRRQVRRLGGGTGVGDAYRWTRYFIANSCQIDPILVLCWRRLLASFFGARRSFFSWAQTCWCPVSSAELRTGIVSLPFRGCPLQRMVRVHQILPFHFWKYGDRAHRPRS